jgi:RNA-directed DNA polymerase
VTLSQGVDFLGYRLVARKGHLNVWINPNAMERFREEVRRLTRRTAGKSLRAMVSRLNRYVRGWGEYFKRAEASGVFDRHDRWITRRLRAYVAKRWRNGLWRRYPDQYFWFQLGLTRLYHLRRDFIRELEARRRAGLSQRELAEAKRKAEQGSQQLQGEALEAIMMARSRAVACSA